jgi:VWFA-related protein
LVAPFSPQATVFRTGTEIATINFLVADKTGSPVSDLTPQDVSLFIEGKRRDVVQLQFFDFSDERPEATLGASAASRASGNTVPRSTRQVIIAANHDAMERGSERQVVAAASDFISHLLPSDELTIVTLPRGGVLATPGMSRRDAINALSTIVGHAEPGRVVSTCFDVRAMDDFLRGITRSIATTIVYVSGSLPTSRDCRLEFEALRDSAESISARVFAIQPATVQDDVGNRFSRPPDPTSQPDGLGDLASVTGGELFLPSGRAYGIFERIKRQMSGRFILAFEPLASERDGKPRRLKIETSKKGATVFAPRSVTIRP